MEFIIPWIITVPKGTNLLSAYNRDMIRFANHALIRGRQMLIRASTMTIFHVPKQKKDSRLAVRKSFGESVPSANWQEAEFTV